MEFHPCNFRFPIYMVRSEFNAICNKLEKELQCGLLTFDPTYARRLLLGPPSSCKTLTFHAIHNEYGWPAITDNAREDWSIMPTPGEYLLFCSHAYGTLEFGTKGDVAAWTVSEARVVEKMLLPQILLPNFKTWIMQFDEFISEPRPHSV